MALQPTLYKLRVALSDINRNRYQTLNLTVAQHPSETLERMMVRVLAFCMNVEDNLAFGKGVSTPEEPDIWARSLDGQVQLWVDVGEPNIERVKKATRTATRTRVYCFNAKAAIWWRQQHPQLSGLNVEVFQFPWGQVQALAALVQQRSMDLSITLSDETAYVATSVGDCLLIRENLQAE